MRFIASIKNIIFHLERWLQLRQVQYVIISGILLITLICVLQPELSVLKFFSMQTVLVLLAWLAAGVIFLMLRSTSLAFVSLFSCAILCLFLKNASNVSLAGPRPLLNEDVKFSVGHFNLSYIQDNLDQSLDLIKDYDRDILIFQEYTPQFRQKIFSYFGSMYPDYIEFMRMDDLGQIIFSNFPIIEKDTLQMYNLPFLRIKVKMNDGSLLNVLSQYNLPPLTDSLKQENRRIFERVSEHISQVEEPLIMAGTFNYVSWDNQMVKFRYEANLHDSRKYFFPSLTQGSKSIFAAPVEHIFYNDYLECIQFKNIENEKSTRIGIRGKYQINPNEKLLSSAVEEN